MRFYKPNHLVTDFKTTFNNIKVYDDLTFSQQNFLYRTPSRLNKHVTYFDISWQSVTRGSKNTHKGPLASNVLNSFFLKKRKNYTTLKNSDFSDRQVSNIHKMTNLLNYNGRSNSMNPSLPDVAVGTSNNLTQLTSFYLFDFNFIKRERLYTKLKYSRSPAYDIVSGGAAAFLAAFIGFLVSEKFGIELVDSGDFYIAFMYGVFFALSLKSLMRILNAQESITNLIFTNLLKLPLRFFLMAKNFVLDNWRKPWFLPLIFSKLLSKYLFVYHILPKIIQLLQWVITLF